MLTMKGALVALKKLKTADGLRAFAKEASMLK